MRFCQLLCVASCVVMLTCPISSRAQTADDGIELLREHLSKQRLERLQSGGLSQPIGQIVKVEGNSPVCFPIERFQIEGITRLPSRKVTKLLNPHKNTCMGNVEIEQLLQNIKQAYAKKGYITTQVVIPAQNLNSKQLNVVVIEGEVEAIQYLRVVRNTRNPLEKLLGYEVKAAIDETGKTITPDLVARPAGFVRTYSPFPFMAGQPLNLRDLEQGVSQVNRIPSVTAKVDILPGEKPGGSIIRVIEERNLKKGLLLNSANGKSVRGSMGYDNRGSRTTGRHRVRATISIDNILRAHDMFQASYSGAERSNAVAASFSIPYGYWTLSASGSYSEEDQQITPLATSFTQTGNGSVSLDRVFFRNQNSIWHINQAIGWLWQQNTINTARLTPLRYAWTRTGINLEYYAKQTRFILDGGITFGLPTMATGNAILPHTAFNPRRTFQKWDAGLTVLHQFSRQTEQQETSHSDKQHLSFLEHILDGTQFYGRFGAQWTSRPLFSSQQLSLSSWNTVRGFLEQSAQGDVGAFMQLELQKSLSLPWINVFNSNQPPPSFAQQHLWPRLGMQATGYAFFDAGVIKHDITNTDETLASTGLGLRLYGQNINLDTLVTIPLHPVSGKREPIRLTLSASFQF